MPRHWLHVVTGAPGSGKSTCLLALLGRSSRYVAFDMDWLLPPASALVGQDIRTSVSLWPMYNALWLEVLRAVHENNRVTVLFAPLSASDLPPEALPAWCAGIEWLLLDCPDTVRRARLTERSEWTEAMVEEAVADARALRESFPQTIDTAGQPPVAVADLILNWLDQAAWQ